MDNLQSEKDRVVALLNAELNQYLHLPIDKEKLTAVLADAWHKIIQGEIKVTVEPDDHTPPQLNVVVSMPA